MADNPNPESLVVGHRCEKCDRVFLPSEINDDASVTGIVICPGCGFVGPMHVVVIGKSELH